MHRHLVLLISISLLILSCFIRYYDYLRTWIACLRARPSIAKRKHKNKSYQYPFLTKRPDCQLCQAEEKLPSEVMPPEPSPLITHAVELPVFQVHGDYYAGNIGVQNGPIVGIFDPFELIELDGAISGRQKSIFSLITERGPITRGECQELLGLRQQYAQNDLYLLYRLGVPGRTMGQRRKAKYFLSRDTED